MRIVTSVEILGGGGQTHMHNIHITFFQKWPANVVFVLSKKKNELRYTAFKCILTCNLKNPFQPLKYKMSYSLQLTFVL